MNILSRISFLGLFIITLNVFNIYSASECSLGANQFPKGFSTLDLVAKEDEKIHQLSKKDEVDFFKKYNYAVTVNNLVEELLNAISEWRHGRLRFIWDLLQRAGGVDRIREHGYNINDFYLKAAEKGNFIALKFFLAMPEVTINIKTRNGFNAFDLALYNAHNWWRHLRRQFPGSIHFQCDYKVINGGHLQCAYYLAKQGIEIAPCLKMFESNKKISNYFILGCSHSEFAQYAKMTAFILYKIEEEKARAAKGKYSIFRYLKKDF